MSGVKAEEEECKGGWITSNSFIEQRGALSQTAPRLSDLRSAVTTNRPLQNNHTRPTAPLLRQPAPINLLPPSATRAQRQVGEVDNGDEGGSSMRALERERRLGELRQQLLALRRREG